MDEGAVGKGDLEEGLVVVFDERFGDDVEESGVSFETGGSDVIARRSCDKPAGSAVDPSPNTNPMTSSVRLARSPARKHKEGVIFSIFWFFLMR